MPASRVLFPTTFPPSSPRGGNLHGRGCSLPPVARTSNVSVPPPPWARTSVGPHDGHPAGPGDRPVLDPGGGPEGHRSQPWTPHVD